MQYLKILNTLDEIYIRLDAEVKIMSKAGEIPRETTQNIVQKRKLKKFEQSPITCGTISSSLTKKWEYI